MTLVTGSSIGTIVLNIQKLYKMSIGTLEKIVIGLAYSVPFYHLIIAISAEDTI